MAKLQRVVGSTSVVLEVFAQDSSSTTGSGLTGLAYNTASLTCYYKRNTGAASVAVTLADITILGTYTSGGFKQVDSSGLPGVYEFHPPDAAFASGARSVIFLLKGAANLAPVPIEVELTAVDNQATSFGLTLAKTTNITGFNDIAATAVVSGGAITTSGGAVSTVTTVGTATNLTNLPAIPSNWLTAAGITAGALDDKGNWLKPTVAGRTLDVSATGEAGLDWANVGGATTTVALSGTTVGTATNLTNLPTMPTDWLTAAGLSAGAVTKAQAGLSTYAGGDTAGTTTLLTRIPGTVQPQTGDSFARLGAPVGASIGADIQTRSTYAGGAVAGVTGTVSANITQVGGVAIPTPSPAGYLPVDIRKVAGSDPTLSSGALTANVTQVKGADLTETTAGNLAGNLSTFFDDADGLAAADVVTIKAVTDKLNTALALSGSVYQFTINALANAPAGGGGVGSGLDAYEKAYLTGPLVVQADGSWVYYDPADGTTPRLKFARHSGRGGRDVTKDPVL